MNEKLTEIVIILDRSASMLSLTDGIIESYNSFMKEQKNIPGEAVLTTVLFNDSIKLLHDRVNIKEIKPITNKDYSAQGKRALLNALGKCINDIGFKLYNTPEHDRPYKIIIFIITNGEDNASREYSQEKVKSMVELQKQTYGWEFIFFGANIDSAAAASSIGIPKNMAFDIAADEEGFFCAHEAMGAALSNLRRYESVTAKEGEDFRKKIKKPKKVSEKAALNIKTKKLSDIIKRKK